MDNKNSGMPVENASLAVRQDERINCDLTAELSVAPVSAAAIRLSAAVANTEGVMITRVVDISLGGVGVRSTVYIPPWCRLQLRVTVDTPAGPKVLETTVRVQRAAMIDRRPSYYLGTSFESPSAELQALVRSFVESHRASGKRAAGEGPRA